MSRPRKSKDSEMVCLAYVAAKDQTFPWIEEVKSVMSGRFTEDGGD